MIRAELPGLEPEQSKHGNESNDPQYPATCRRTKHDFPQEIMRSMCWQAGLPDPVRAQAPPGCDVLYRSPADESAPAGAAEPQPTAGRRGRAARRALPRDPQAAPPPRYHASREPRCAATLRACGPALAANADVSDSQARKMARPGAGCQYPPRG